MNIAKEVHEEFFNFDGFNSFVEPKVVKKREKKEVVAETNEETPQIIVEETLSGWSELENI